jgi:hypothetical protein
MGINILGGKKTRRQCYRWTRSCRVLTFFFFLFQNCFVRQPISARHVKFCRIRLWMCVDVRVCGKCQTEKKYFHTNFGALLFGPTLFRVAKIFMTLFVGHLGDRVTDTELNGKSYTFCMRVRYGARRETRERSDRRLI